MRHQAVATRWQCGAARTGVHRLKLILRDQRSPSYRTHTKIQEQGMSRAYFPILESIRLSGLLCEAGPFCESASASAEPPAVITLGQRPRPPCVPGARCSLASPPRKLCGLAFCVAKEHEMCMMLSGADACHTFQITGTLGLGEQLACPPLRTAPWVSAFSTIRQLTKLKGQTLSSRQQIFW